MQGTLSRKNRLSEGGAGKFMVVIGEKQLKGCEAVVFDLDGVLVDSSARFRKALEEAGVSEEEFRSDKKARSKVWEVFLSEKYIALDRPVEEAISILKERSRTYPVVILTGRPESMKDATVKQLKDFGIEFHALVMRGNGNLASDDAFKEKAISLLGIRPVEIHDDSPRVLYRLAEYPELGSYYWYAPGKHAYVPPVHAYVGDKKVKLYEVREVVKATISRRKAVVKYAGRTYSFEDGIHAMGFLLMQKEMLEKRYCIPLCIEEDGTVFDLLDVLYDMKRGSEAPQANSVLKLPEEVDVKQIEEYVVEKAEEIAHDVAIPEATVYGPIPTAQMFDRDTFAILLNTRIKFLHGAERVPGKLRPSFEKSLYDPTHVESIMVKNGLVFAVYRGTIVAYKTYDATVPALPPPSKKGAGTFDIVKAIKNLHSSLQQFLSVFEKVSRRFRKELEELGVGNVGEVYLLGSTPTSMTVGTICRNCWDNEALLKLVLSE